MKGLWGFSGRPEPLEPLGEVVGVGVEEGVAGDAEAFAVHVFQAGVEHRAVVFGQDVVTDVDDAIGGDAEDVVRMADRMDLAEGEAVGDFGPAAFVPIGEDVGGALARVVADAADGAAGLVGAHHQFAEAALVEAHLDLAGLVGAAGREVGAADPGLQGEGGQGVR